jgi:hypothetical protein
MGTDGWRLDGGWMLGDSDQATAADASLFLLREKPAQEQGSDSNVFHGSAAMQERRDASPKAVATRLYGTQPHAEPRLPSALECALHPVWLFVACVLPILKR